MSLTYSVNTNTTTEAYRLSGVQPALSELLDNTSQLISPHDVRDAVFTSWENIVLKQTTVASSLVEYIGIDDQTMVAQTGTGLKEKFLIGKRQTSGQNTMNNTILTSDIDIFFYNTKSDSGQQYTKVAFLAGTNSTAYSTAPYIYAQDIVGGTIDLTIMNPNGNLIFNPSQNGVLTGTWSYGISASLPDQLVNKYYVDSKLGADISGTTNSIALFTGSKSISNSYLSQGTNSVILSTGVTISSANQKNYIDLNNGYILTGASFSLNTPQFYSYAMNINDAPKTSVNSSTTLTGTQILTGIITSTSPTSVTMSTPTSSNFYNNFLPLSGSSFQFYIDNTSGSSLVTFSLGTGWTASMALTGSNNMNITSGMAGLFQIYVASSSLIIVSRVL